MLVLVGAEGGAWYHLAWTVAYTLYLVSSAVGYALLAEGAHEPAALEANARRALGQSLALVVPAATVIVVGAPWILRLFGADYATEGTQPPAAPGRCRPSPTWSPASTSASSGPAGTCGPSSACTPSSASPWSPGPRCWFPSSA